MKKILASLCLIAATLCVLGDNFTSPASPKRPPLPASISFDGSNYTIALTVTPGQLRAYLPLFAYSRTGASTNLAQVLGNFSQSVVDGAANSQIRGAQLLAVQGSLSNLLTQLPANGESVSFNP